MTLRLLEPDRILARRRPLAVLFVWVAELASALVVAAPAHAWARRAWGAHPDGDGVLWAPGGRDLVAWLGAMDAAEATVLRLTLLSLIAFAVLAQIPLALLLASLATGRGEEGRAPSLSEAHRASAGAFVPLLTVLAAVSGLELLLAGLGALAASSASRALERSLSEIGALRSGAVVFLPFALAIGLVGVFGDLARAGMAREVARAEAIETAWVTLARGVNAARLIGRRALASAMLAWAWRAALGVLLVLVGAAASDALGGRGGTALFVLFAIHQACALGRAGLRASWLARALRFVAARGRALEEAEGGS